MKLYTLNFSTVFSLKNQCIVYYTKIPNILNLSHKRGLMKEVLNHIPNEGWRSCTEYSMMWKRYNRKQKNAVMWWEIYDNFNLLRLYTPHCMEQWLVWNA